MMKKLIKRITVILTTLAMIVSLIPSFTLTVSAADPAQPTVTSVSSTTANGTYKTGDTVNVTVTFSKAVTVTGTPQLTLETGTTDRAVNYTSGSGTGTLSFSYTVQAGDTSSDLDYISTSALTLNGGTIKDADDNDAVLTLPSPGGPGSLGANKELVIDGIAPTVVNVSSSTANGSYGLDETIVITVLFSEAVTVEYGIPQLTLETGATDRTVNYTSGSGIDTLSFQYTVQAGDTSYDLDYTATSALSLNGGTIRDAAGNYATLTLPTPGAAGSLGANKALVVNGIVPSVPAAPSAPDLSYSSDTGTSHSDNITNDNTPTFTGTAEAGSTVALLVDSASAGTASANGSGSWDVTLPVQSDGVYSITATASNGSETSAASSSLTITIDTAAPGAPTISTVAQTVNADNITVTGTAEADAAIEIAGGSSTATGIAAGGNYTVIVDLTQNAANALIVKATDAAGNESPTASVVITENSSGPTYTGTITPSEVSSNSVKLTWSAATDDDTPQNQLRYMVVYSPNNNISNASDAETNGTISTSWTMNLITATVSGLTPNVEYYFTVLVQDLTGNKQVYPSIMQKTASINSSGGSHKTSSGSATSSSTMIQVNGQNQDAGTSSTRTTEGQTVTTITVDDAKLDKIIETSGKQSTVMLTANTASDIVVGELNGQTFKNMAEKDTTLEIKTKTATYTLPASQIKIDDVSAQIGEQVALNDIKVHIKIASPSADTAKILDDAAKKSNYHLVLNPVEFTIICTSGSKAVEVSRFNSYVDRTIALSNVIDPSKVTTAVVLNNDGTFSHIPTAIVTDNGKYYAKISSLTNSVYSLINHPIEFTDVASHWAKAAVNDMGSRTIVTGMDDESYEPDRKITRAEFAAIIVRALGLQKGYEESAFNDVAMTDWFNGYVDTATDYALITGYDNTSFCPNDAITREQAMVILARAMKLTKASADLTDNETASYLANYTDAASVSDYAKTSVTICLKASVVSGSSADTLSPKAYVTRAEIAVMMQRLLQKSELI